MAEWFKAAVLKTVVRKYRGFESYSLRHIFKIDGLVRSNHDLLICRIIIYTYRYGEVAELA